VGSPLQSKPVHVHPPLMNGRVENTLSRGQHPRHPTPATPLVTLGRKSSRGEQKSLLRGLAQGGALVS